MSQSNDTLLVSEEYIIANYECQSQDGIDTCYHSHHDGILIQLPKPIDGATDFIVHNCRGDIKHGNWVRFVSLKQDYDRTDNRLMLKWEWHYVFENVLLNDFLTLCKKIGINQKPKIVQPTRQQKITFIEFLEKLK